MAQYQHLPLYKSAYDLLTHIIIFSKQFPREHKYTLGQKLRDEALEIILGVYRANSSKNRVEEIDKILENIQTVEVIIRVCHDLRVLPQKHYVVLAEKAESIARQSSGWRKSADRGVPERT